MRYAYKVVAAPRRAKRGKGFKTPAEAFCGAFEAVLAEHGDAGWEYLRTDLVPMEARHGLLGGLRETHQGVMVFRRPLEAAPSRAIEPISEPGPAPRREEPVSPPPLGAARLD